jgi:hypothetical protein
MRSFAALLAVFAVACTDDKDPYEPPDCSTVKGTDTFVVGLAKAGEAGALDFALMSITPSPAMRGDNTWIVAIADTNGQPFDGASLTVTPFMPAEQHQHNSPIRVEVTPVAGVPGQYTLSPVNLWMPGIWETTLLASSGDTTDSAVYTFCIN